MEGERAFVFSADRCHSLVFIIANGSPFRSLPLRLDRRPPERFSFPFRRCSGSVGVERRIPILSLGFGTRTPLQLLSSLLVALHPGLPRPLGRSFLRDATFPQVSRFVCVASPSLPYV